MFNSQRDWFGTPRLQPFPCFGTPIWLLGHHVKMKGITEESVLIVAWTCSQRHSFWTRLPCWTLRAAVSLVVQTLCTEDTSALILWVFLEFSLNIKYLHLAMGWSECLLLVLETNRADLRLSQIWSPLVVADLLDSHWCLDHYSA